MKTFLVLSISIIASSVSGQVPTVKFSSAEVSVSQRAGYASIPVTVENANSIGNYLSVIWTTNSGSAMDHVDFGDNSGYYDYQTTGGGISIYPGQTTATISVPINNTCSTIDKTFAVRITEAVDVQTQGAAIGTPSVVTVTILGDAAYLQGLREKRGKLQKQIKKAKKIKDSKKRKRKVKRLTRKVKAIEILLC